MSTICKLEAKVKILEYKNNTLDINLGEYNRVRDEEATSESALTENENDQSNIQQEHVIEFKRPKFKCNIYTKLNTKNILTNHLSIRASLAPRYTLLFNTLFAQTKRRLECSRFLRELEENA